MNGGRVAFIALPLLVALSKSLPAQCPDGAPPPCRAGRVAAAPPRNSVAVLYFDNLSSDTTDAYLADGLTEEIASRLGDIRRLLVKQASREGVRRLRETTPDYRITVGRAMGVRHLVEGSVRRAGMRVRVVARLVNATNGFRAWGQTYERPAEDLLALEEDIAREVATAIAGELAPVERTALTERPTANADAYEHFLRGNYYLAKRSAAALTRAIQEYEEASRLDPTFARAWARAGYAYALNVRYAWSLSGLSRDTMLARGRAATSRALEQDSSLSDAWMAWGFTLTLFDHRNFDRGLAGLERALELDPRNSEALGSYGASLRSVGRDSAARAAMRRSLAIEPGRSVTLHSLALLSLLEHRYDDARRWADSSLRVNPEFFLAYLTRARTRLMLGDAPGARADAEVALRLGSADSTLGEALLTMVEARRGDTAAARAHLSRIAGVLPGMMVQVRERAAEEGLLPAAALLAVGDRAGALAFLEGVQPRGARFWSGLRYPELDALRADPRFQRLVEESRPPGAPR
jgi:TolB-like protein/Tfp pilus assembly protein PilF